MKLSEWATRTMQLSPITAEVAGKRSHWRISGAFCQSMPHEARARYEERYSALPPLSAARPPSKGPCACPRHVFQDGGHAVIYSTVVGRGLGRVKVAARKSCSIEVKAVTLQSVASSETSALGSVSTRGPGAEASTLPGRPASSPQHRKMLKVNWSLGS